MNTITNLKLTAVALTALTLTSFTDGKTRGIGVYPGNPAESYAPSLRTDNAYRNVALHRIVRTSSQHDLNLTPQLLTDGIIATNSPQYLEATTNSGVLQNRERESGIDGNEYTNMNLMGTKAWLQYRWNNMLIKADKVKIICTVAYKPAEAKKGYSVKVSVDNKVVAEETGKELPGKESKQRVSSDPNKQTASGELPLRIVEMELPIGKSGKVEFDNLRFNFDMAGAAYWTVTEIKFFNNGQAVTDLQPARDFTSAWMSDKGGQQWAYVDLGTAAEIDNVKLSWIEKAVKGRVDVATEMGHWTTVAQLPGGKALDDNIKFEPVKARFVRVLMTQPTATGRYIMSEVEVMGRGGLVAQPHALGGMKGDRYLLNGGSWQVQRASEVKGSGEQISQAAFNTNGWVAATVPGTVLTSYVNVGALPDPALADNWDNASESFFNSNFWYRTAFNLPTEMKGKHVFLNFDGINWKANVYLNGKKIDRIEGAFTRSKVDITNLLNANGANILAVEIVKNAHPGSIKVKNRKNTDFNGGILGYDNPTFHATIGWDWITTVRGRDIGIWNDVALTTAGDVSLSDPVVTTTLTGADNKASMTPTVVLANNEGREVKGELRGWIGNISFSKTVTLAPNATQEVSFSPDEFAQLKEQNMKLWWPNGYGTPYLYKAGFEFATDEGVQSRTCYKAGIRQMTYKDIDTRLTMYINGKRFIPLGGNWGFSEQNLLYRGREYDIAVRYHRDMNFNMIRNWVGMTGDEEFYEACDKYGIMVWQDFWLANPCDGPDPQNEDMFLANARDYTLRMRQHPSIGLYCGRNEGYPPATIDKALRQYVAAMNPGMGYISSSADDGVSGHGPYWACTPKFYFEHQTGKLHSERGMPNVMTFEGLSRTLAPNALWPQGDAWGEHDYGMEGAQRGASFNGIIEKAFGKVTDARQFTALAQWENYDGYRAMYESGSKDRMGLIIWMSHSCWPSMTWCCYDYYFEPTAAFFGSKKACEPLHIQLNASTRNPEVVNLAAGEHKQLTAKREVIGLDGKTVKEDVTTLDTNDDTTTPLQALHVDDSYDLGGKNVYIVRLTLSDSNGKVLSTNTYVDSNDHGNLQDLNTLPVLGENDIKVSVETVACKDAKKACSQAQAKGCSAQAKGCSAQVNGCSAQAAGCNKSRRIITLENTSKTPAMMVRLNLLDGDGDQILPVDYSDNYFHLLPGEKRTIKVAWNNEDMRKGNPVVDVTGFNVK